MTNKSATPSPIAPLGGVVVGIAVFLGVNITTGRAIIPNAASVTNAGRSPIPAPVYPPTEVQVVGGGGPYQTVCATCHQAEGQGIPGAFPPLAGSEWVTGNPEVSIRIALLGLSGPIEVKGATFNSIMPPPPGLDDAQIAEAITYARTHFGNNASKVEAEQVKQVRSALAGRTDPFKAEELKSMLGAAPAAGEGAAGAPAEGAAGAAGAPTQGAAAGAPAPAPAEGAAPAAGAPAPTPAPAKPAAPAKPPAATKRAAPPTPAPAPAPTPAP